MLNLFDQDRCGFHAKPCTFVLFTLPRRFVECLFLPLSCAHYHCSAFFLGTLASVGISVAKSYFEITALLSSCSVLYMCTFPSIIRRPPRSVEMHTLPVSDLRPMSTLHASRCFSTQPYFPVPSSLIACSVDGVGYQLHA